VSRTRCSVLHDAPQIRDPANGLDPGSAAHRKRAALHPGNVVARHFGIDHPNHWLSVRSPNTATYLMNIISVTMTSRQIDIFFSVYHLGR
jgi:hypothetical protein